MSDVRIESILRCPACRSSLILDSSSGEMCCSACGRDAGQVSGVLDLRPPQQRTAEQAHYESVYTEHQRDTNVDPWSAWSSLYYPANRAVLERVGDARGKRIVLLGNGTSEKEFAFLEQDPALLVFSDLSPTAVETVRERLFPQGLPNLLFAAIDALELPVVDASVDLVYGYAFVHHLPDVDAFLRETARVLRPGGRAVFMDDAYSPVWQGAKRTLLRPLMRYFHRQQMPSPEDLRFTLEGGFREDRLARRIGELGCEPWFERSGFVHYLVTRASERLPPQRVWRALVGSEAVLRRLIRLDEVLSRVPGMYRNQIRLVWGFEKPIEFGRVGPAESSDRP